MEEEWNGESKNQSMGIRHAQQILCCWVGSVLRACLPITRLRLLASLQTLSLSTAALHSCSIPMCSLLPSALLSLLTSVSDTCYKTSFCASHVPSQDRAGWERGKEEGERGRLWRSGYKGMPSFSGVLPAVHVFHVALAAACRYHATPALLPLVLMPTLPPNITHAAVLHTLLLYTFAFPYTCLLPTHLLLPLPLPCHATTSALQAFCASRFQTLPRCVTRIFWFATYNFLILFTTAIMLTGLFSVLRLLPHSSRRQHICAKRCSACSAAAYGMRNACAFLYRAYTAHLLCFSGWIGHAHLVIPASSLLLRRLLYLLSTSSDIHNAASSPWPCLLTFASDILDVLYGVSSYRARMADDSTHYRCGRATCVTTVVCCPSYICLAVWT